MVEEKELSKMKFQGLLEWLCKLKWLTADEADNANQQFDEVVDTECPKHREKFASFDKLYDAVDVFLSNFLHKIILEVQSILEGVQHHLCALSWPECCRKRIQHQQGIIS